jgi:hypothetical protein
VRVDYSAMTNILGIAPHAPPTPAVQAGTPRIPLSIVFGSYSRFLPWRKILWLRNSLPWLLTLNWPAGLLLQSQITPSGTCCSYHYNLRAMACNSFHYILHCYAAVWSAPPQRCSRCYKWSKAPMSYFEIINNASFRS